MNKNVKNVINPRDYEKCPELAEVCVSYKSKFKSKIKISSSRDCYNILYPLFNCDTLELKEEFFILLLNRANNFMGWYKLSSGGTSGTVVDIKIIFMLALMANAHGIILCHNHPSQNIQPSAADIKLTKQIKDAGLLLDIKVLDHMIITSNGSYFDFADEGLL